ncbi:DUF3606 domain-containing protein [Hymenobacter coalescens]
MTFYVLGSDTVFAPIISIFLTMPDDLTNRGPADRARVNVNEPHERRYWCREFNCSEAQLRAAVEAVGVMADKVRRYIAGH